MHLYPVENRTVVIIDILRATSCMTTGIAHGIGSITPFADLEACRAMQAQGYIIGAERGGEKVAGFTLGNSPFEFMDPALKGKDIAVTTTNGTQAIQASQGAAEIVIGAFLNLTAVANHLRHTPHDILLVCAGWKGKVNLEDTLYAGALLHHLQDAITPACDAPLMARHLYEQAQHDLFGFLQTSSHVQRLRRLNIEKDIAYCLETDRYDVLPMIQNGKIIAC